MVPTVEDRPLCYKTKQIPSIYSKTINDSLINLGNYGKKFHGDEKLDGFYIIKMKV